MKRLLILLILTGFILTACAGSRIPVTAVPESTRIAQKLLQQAMENYTRGCDEIALDYLFRAHELFSLDDRVNSVAVCLNNMGNIYRRSGDIDDALLFFDEAVTLFQRTGDSVGAGRTLVNKAAALVDDNRLEAAETVLNEAAIRIPPKSPSSALLLNHRAILLIRQGRYEAAESVLRQAAALVSDPETAAYATVKAGLGNLMLQLDRYEEAIEFLENAYQADHRRQNIPAMADGLAALATACLAREMFDEGIDYLKRSLKLYALTGRVSQANNQFEKLTRIADERDEDITVISRFVGKWLRGEAVMEYCR